MNYSNIFRHIYDVMNRDGSWSLTRSLVRPLYCACDLFIYYSLSNSSQPHRAHIDTYPNNFESQP